MRLLLCLCAANIVIAQPVVSSRDPRWQTVGVGPLASRPSQCTANRHVYICNGSGCPGNGVYYYCTATNTWTLGSGTGGSAVWGSIAGTLTDQTDLKNALDAKQPFDTDLTTIAGLTCSNGQVMVWSGSAWTCGSNVPSHTHAASDVTSGTFDVSRIPDLSSLYQPLDSDLTTIAGLSCSSGQVMVWSGTAWQCGANVPSHEHAASDITSGTLGLSRGGTNQTAWTAGRCVQVASDGAKLESASAACGSGGSGSLEISDNANNKVGDATRLQFKNGTGMTWTLVDEGSGRISAKPDVDTTGLVTLSGTQTMTNKTLTQPSLGTSPLTVQVANDTSTGTELNKLAKLTGSPSKAVRSTMSDTNGLLGIVVAGAGTSGSAEIAVSGRAQCNFTGATTAGYYVIPSSSENGKCAATSSWPTDGTQVLGFVLNTASDPAGNQDVFLFPSEMRGATGGGSVAWGSITGTLSDQIDLKNALDGKQPLDTDLTTIAGLTCSSGQVMVWSGAAWECGSAGGTSYWSATGDHIYNNNSGRVYVGGHTWSDGGLWPTTKFAVADSSIYYGAFIVNSDDHRWSINMGLNTPSAFNLWNIGGHYQGWGDGDGDLRFENNSVGTVLRIGYLSGRLGIGTSSTPLQRLEVNGGVMLRTTDIKPTCDADARGTFWVTQAGTGVKDSVEVCAKDASDTYAWRTLY